MNPEILMNAGNFESLAIMFLLSSLAMIAGSWIYSRPPFGTRIATPVLLAIVFSVIVLIVRVVTSNELAADEVTWHNQGVLVSNVIAGNATLQEGNLSAGKAGYAWLAGSFYFLTGPAPLLLILLNILLFALVVPIVAVITGIIAEELGFSEKEGARSVQFAAYFVALMPTIVFWVPRMLRETISMFLISFSVMCLLLLMRSNKALYLLGVISAVVFMFTIRAQVGAALLAGLIMGVVIAKSLKFSGMVSKIIFVVPLFFVMFFAAWNFADSTRDLSLENTANRNRALANASSAFAGAEEVQSAESILDIILFNLPRVTLWPFPHELNFSSVMLLAGVSNAFWLYAIFLTCHIAVYRRNLSCVRKSTDGQAATPWRSVLVLVAIVATLTFILAISSGNYGLVVRQRLMPFVALIPLAGIGFTILSTRKYKFTTVKN